MKTKNSYTVSDIVVLLICVIFIVAGLAAVGAGGRRRAKLKLCSNNLRQFAIVWDIYTQSNDGFFHERNWLRASRPLVKKDKIYCCPTATKTLDEGAVQPFAAQQRDINFNVSYAFNNWLESRDAAWGEEEIYWKTIYVDGADNIPLMMGSAKATLITPSYSDDPPMHEEDVIANSGPSFSEMKRVCVNRHNGSVNALMLDFSVGPVGLKQLWQLDWHRNWNPNGDPPPTWPEWMANFKDY